MTQIILSVVGSVLVIGINTIIALLVRQGRQIARIVQYHDSGSEVSRQMGGTLPDRVSKLERKVGIDD